jgi:hypothetical protein
MASGAALAAQPGVGRAFGAVEVMKRTAFHTSVLLVALTAVAQERDTSVAEAWLDGKSGAMAKQQIEATLAAWHRPPASLRSPASCLGAAERVNDFETPRGRNLVLH